MIGRVSGWASSAPLSAPSHSVVPCCGLLALHWAVDTELWIGSSEAEQAALTRRAGISKFPRSTSGTSVVVPARWLAKSKVGVRSSGAARNTIWGICRFGAASGFQPEIERVRFPYALPVLALGADEFYTLVA